jgi:predicted RNA binding protein YcfA (HicA-like mRNA interferase family)
VTKPPVISGDECISALRHLGYSIARIKGDHVRLRCTGRNPVIIPRHHTFDRGTLKSILRTIELTSDEFIELLKR